MRTKKIIAFLGSMVMLAGVSACGTNDPTASTTSDGKTIIKIQTFNNYGYGKSTAERPGANLWAEYEKQNPNVKIEETVASSSDEARTAFNTAISSGSNAYDIYGVDISWMPSIRAMADKFTDLSSYTKQQLAGLGPSGRRIHRWQANRSWNGYRPNRSMLPQRSL